MTNTPIGRALAEARQRAGLDRVEAAAELGVDRTTVYRWETGSRTPNGLAERALRDVIARWNAGGVHHVRKGDRR